MAKKIKLTLELTETQLNQILVSLHNDWVDNTPPTQRVITNIINKIERQN